MGERLQVRTGLGIREDDVAQRRTVEVTIGCKNFPAEALDEPLEGRLPQGLAISL